MKNKRSGYTLVELMFSLGIFSVILGSLFSIIIYQNTYFTQAAGKMEVSFAARKAMSGMMKELRISKVELVEVYDKPRDEAGTESYLNGRSVKFQVPVNWEPDGDFFDEYGTIEWGADGNKDWSIEYYWDSANNRLIRRIWNAASVEVSKVTIAENISAFNIIGYKYNAVTMQLEKNAACEVIGIELTAQKTTLSGRTLTAPLTLTLSNFVKWRN